GGQWNILVDRRHFPHNLSGSDQAIGVLASDTPLGLAIVFKALEFRPVEPLFFDSVERVSHNDERVKPRLDLLFALLQDIPFLRRKFLALRNTGPTLLRTRQFFESSLLQAH